MVLDKANNGINQNSNSIACPITTGRCIAEITIGLRFKGTAWLEP